MGKAKKDNHKKPLAVDVHEALRKAHEFRSMDTDSAIDRTAEIINKFFPNQLEKEGKEHYP